MVANNTIPFENGINEEEYYSNSWSYYTILNTFIVTEITFFITVAVDLLKDGEKR